MIQLRYSERALRDLERFVRFLDARAPDVTADAVGAILEAVEVLRHSPLIGRPTGRRGLRELVVAWGQNGYVVLYRLRGQRADIVALRHQREGGYRR